MSQQVAMPLLPQLTDDMEGSSRGHLHYGDEDDSDYNHDEDEDEDSEEEDEEEEEDDGHDYTPGPKKR